MVSTITSVENTSQTSPNSEVTQLANFVKEHEKIEMILPVLLGLFITSRLQLRGANALLVNLGIATVLRQVFKELKHPTVSPEKKTTAPEMDHSDVFGDGVKIVHSVPGRIRLRIDQIAGDRLFAKHLERLLRDDDHVLGVRFNASASSVAIQYDAGSFSDMELGLRLMDILNKARLGEAIA
ncbi:HMA2 domain-containing protein [Picosynechococcus sp. PCC 11901]|uniref:HMA2 domain-containing protein n=1 Tax=Picosynechococcus sp. PCC 11901 TaxID=2579791 RepID=UPI0015E8C175|nr:metal ABC transporter ATPase [Picosynechococcus sp. PCC 11901]